MENSEKEQAHIGTEERINKKQTVKFGRLLFPHYIALGDDNMLNCN